MIYIDQISNVLNTECIHMFSSYTPHGIRSIDTNYCMRIQNINSKIKQTFQINRRPEICFNVKTGKEYVGLYKTYYDEIDPFNAKIGLGLRVIWEDDYGNITQHDFTTSDNIPKIYHKSRIENPQHLMYEIMDDPHLHQTIKDNLLSNLESVLNII